MRRRPAGQAFLARRNPTALCSRRSSLGENAAAIEVDRLDDEAVLLPDFFQIHDAAQIRADAGAAIAQGERARLTVCRREAQDGKKRRSKKKDES